MKIYLKKFKNINNCIKNIVPNIGSCDFIVILKIRKRDSANDKKIMPITSLNPAIA